MPSDLVVAFTRAVLARLHEAEQIVVAPERRDAVVDHVAAELGDPRPGRQVVSTLLSALMSCPDVEEVFADVDDLLAVVSEL